MKIAVVGCGSIGSRHIRNLIALGVSVGDIGAFDPDMEAVRRIEQACPGINAHGHQEGFRTDVELLCTPASAHAVGISHAIRSGTPFFVEKPATLGVSELTEAEWQTDVPHLVGYNWRWHLDYRRAATMAHLADDVRFVCKTDPSKWPGNSYGPRVFECSHEIDLALAWLGPLENEPIIRDYGDSTIIHTHHISQQNARIEYRWNWARKSWVRSVELSFPWSRFINDDDRECIRYLGSIDGSTLDESYISEMRHFLAVVRGEEKSINTLSQAKRVVEICEQAEQMASVSR